MVTPAGALARVLYGLLFVVAVPLGLWLWALRLAPVVPLPAVHAPLTGAGVSTVGLALLMLGIADLIRRGRGLVFGVGEACGDGKRQNQGTQNHFGYLGAGVSIQT